MPVKEKVGIVISDKMEKTFVIKVESRYSHPIYLKTMKKKNRVTLFTFILTRFSQYY